MTSWQTKKLGDVFDRIEGGGTPSKENFSYWGGDIPWASVKDLTTFNPDKTQECITQEGLENSSSRLVQSGTLITPTRMALGFAVRFNIDVAINQDLKAVYPNESTDEDFLYYWFEANRKGIERLGSGSTVAGIQVSDLKNYRLTLPPKPEQQRIVTILEKWDEGIEALERKIELKEQLKKGLMQQLLTGKLRLPGFTDEWREVRIGDLGQVITGSTPSMNDPSNYGNGYCWATAEDFKGKYIKHTNVMLSDKGRESARMLPIGAILVTCIASIGKNAIASVGLATNQQINSIIVNGSFDNEFIYYYIEQNVNLLKRFAGSSALPILNKGDFESIKITIPVSRDEQSSIAIILSQLDDEISALNKKLTQLKLQKKFLLQNLITGKIRTPEGIEVAK